jgi:hypothetical protein
MRGRTKKTNKYLGVDFLGDYGNSSNSQIKTEHIPFSLTGFPETGIHRSSAMLVPGWPERAPGTVTA